MCGIAGIINYRFDPPAVDQGELLRVREAMSVRGPDRGLRGWAKFIGKEFCLI